MTEVLHPTHVGCSAYEARWPAVHMPHASTTAKVSNKDVCPTPPCCTKGLKALPHSVRGKLLNYHRFCKDSADSNLKLTFPLLVCQGFSASGSWVFVFRV